ncbi:helix-turn-helix domain-containing protein [Mycolicibacterium sp. P9-22]|uniref:winged helix-turn-helix transcriptional regulator n=1 Tax=Mycolicibacterium sp. P9-22 TaxID=2024613 RepID=UPI001D14F837|nr:helix-turn-helix domain-containing protein [Mycolicibacterium sp. P9-22]
MSPHTRTPTPRACPIAASLDILGERWTLLAVREISYGTHRFDKIAKYTGASRDILTDRLHKLVDAGVLERRQYSERPPRYEYHLTEAGSELAPVLTALTIWGNKWAPDAPYTSTVHDCGQPLAVHMVCDHCGGGVGAPAEFSGSGILDV